MRFYSSHHEIPVLSNRGEGYAFSFSLAQSWQNAHVHMLNNTAETIGLTSTPASMALEGIRGSIVRTSYTLHGKTSGESFDPLQTVQISGCGEAGSRTCMQIHIIIDSIPGSPPPALPAIQKKQVKVWYCSFSVTYPV